MQFVKSFSTGDLPDETTEVLVVGSGVAGLRSALSASRHYTVTIVTKSNVKSSNTWWAQGGIAAVLQDDDSYESHVQDTLEAGDGLCDVPAVEGLVRNGPEEVRNLIDWGADFDRSDGELDYGREGGHSRSRIVHGRGDATGSLVEDTLVEQVRMNPKITIHENTMVVDLLTDQNRFYGALLSKQGEERIIWARATVLATGGAGQLFRETTNHSVATGDGLGLALRSGLELQDMEFVQFHPTTLYVAGGPRFLISEAVRGEGGILLDEDGNRFMEDIHPMAELAPRDIVSRAILRRMIETDSESVYLDVTDRSEEFLREKFPTIYEVCEEFGIDISEDSIPVRPCAHYYMGGVRSDLQGRTSIKNLFVAGEVACTGAHGANRLASNSLLEGLVMGGFLERSFEENLPELERQEFKNLNLKRRSKLDISDLTRSLKSLMWREVGILRDEDGLTKARDQILSWLGLTQDYNFRTREGIELRNMLEVCRAICETALSRNESRGAHFREDFPERNDPEMRRHSLISGDDWNVRYLPVRGEPDDRSKTTA